MFEIALGSGLGALLRWQLTTVIKRQVPLQWPVATLAINLLGVVALAWLTRQGILMVGPINLTSGVLGGLTTFSTLTVEAVTLLDEHRYGAFVSYLMASYGGGLLIYGLI